MKIADLDSIDDGAPYVAHVYAERADTPLHIMVGTGHKKWGKHRREIFHITRCNRLLSWRVNRNNSLRGRRLCARCGSRKDFEIALYERYEHDRGVREKRRRKEVLDDALRAAELNWSQVSVAVGEEIVEEAESIIASGKVVIPLEKDDLARIRMILARTLSRLNKLSHPMHHQTVGSERLHEIRIEQIEHLLNDVLVY